MLILGYYFLTYSNIDLCQKLRWMVVCRIPDGTWIPDGARIPDGNR
jgi:hypothetical protein